MPTNCSDYRHFVNSIRDDDSTLMSRCSCGTFDWSGTPRRTDSLNGYAHAGGSSGLFRKQTQRTENESRTPEEKKKKKQKISSEIKQKHKKFKVWVEKSLENGKKMSERVKLQQPRTNNKHNEVLGKMQWMMPVGSGRATSSRTETCITHGKNVEAGAIRRVDGHCLPWLYGKMFIFIPAPIFLSFFQKQNQLKRVYIS